MGGRRGKKGLYEKWREPDKLILLRGWRRNGATLEQIAQNIGIRPQTLSEWNKKYPEITHALKVGKEYANFRIENKLFEKALSGNVTAMIFWLKNNWRDKYNDSTLSKEERNLFVEKQRKMKADADIAEIQAKNLNGAISDVNKAIQFVDDVPTGDVDNADDKNT